MPDDTKTESESTQRWTRLVLIGAIVLVPTMLVAFLVFSTERGSAPAAVGPVTAAPVLADGRSATRELIASLDPSLACVAIDQTTIARVDELVAGSHLELDQVPPPAGAVACDGGGLERNYIVFTRADDARSLFEAAASVAGATPVTSGPATGCRNFAVAGTGAVTVLCDDHPDVVWTARAAGLDATAVLAQLAG